MSSSPISSEENTAPSSAPNSFSRGHSPKFRQTRLSVMSIRRSIRSSRAPVSSAQAAPAIISAPGSTSSFFPSRR